MNKGIYFSANDKVYNWTLAFLRSFREHNPDLLLYLIPFDENIQAIAQLSSKYDFKIYKDPSFQILEELGESYELGHSSYGKFWFRRYAAFWGPLDYFMYLDARQLVLADLNPVLKILANDQLDFLYYDLAIDQVYEAGELRQNLLKNKLARGFLSGLWASKWGLFTLEEMLEYGYKSLQLRDQLNSRNTDQAFINFCIDSKPHLRTAHIAEILGGYVQQSWAGQRGEMYKNGSEHFWWDYGGLDHTKKVMLLHWAGYDWNSALPQVKWLNKYSKASISTRFLRNLNGVKRLIKGNLGLRKILGHV